MPYTEKARQMRRCTYTHADARQCRGWAVWGDPRRVCGAHGGRNPASTEPSERTRFVPCTCVAYAWPHRPGGGLCRWPDEPEWRCTRPAGTRAVPRHPEERELLRRLTLMYRQRRREAVRRGQQQQQQQPRR